MKFWIKISIAVAVAGLIFFYVNSSIQGLIVSVILLVLAVLGHIINNLQGRMELKRRRIKGK